MTETPVKRRRWLYPVLFLSLALNLLIVGMVVGWMASPHGPRGSNFGGARGLVGEPFLRALPDDQRRALIRDMAREAPRIRESRDSLRTRFNAFLEALRADPYDTDRVAALLRDQRDAALRRNEMGEQLLLERLAAMTPDQRRAYADALETSLKRLKRRED